MAKKPLHKPGDTFPNITLLHEEPPGNRGQARWLCKCICNNEFITTQNNLRSGHTKSCGCLKKSLSIKRSTTHGLSKTRLYKIYMGMKERCYDSNNHNYIRYGSRGIKICEEWLDDFTVFHTWSINNGYSDNLSIDRIIGHLHYSPDNCRWTNPTIQARNSTKGQYRNKPTSSKYIGVSFYTRDSKWVAQITVNNKCINLGKYISEVEAAQVRDDYILKNKLPGYNLNFGSNSNASSLL